MAENKKSVLLYCDIIHTVEKLDDETAGLLFKHYLRYINDQDPTTDNLLVDVSFEHIKQNLKRDLKKWETRADRSRENGKLGGRPKKPKQTQETQQVISEPRKPVKDTVTVNVTDTDTVKVKDINNILLSEINISNVEDDLKDYFEIAKAFQDLFIKNLTDKKSSCVHQKKATFKNYVNPIRLMMTNDEISKEQLQSVWGYLNSDKGEFWKSNILSTKKLREKFQQLIMKANEKSKNGQANTVGDTGVSAEYLQQLQQDLQS